MPNVCHFLRKSSQLRASFINNQMSHHVSYLPFLVHRLLVTRDFDGGYAEFKMPLVILDLSQGQSLSEKLLYEFPKYLSERQVSRVNDFIKSNHIEIAHFHYGTDCGIYHPLLRSLKIPSVVSFYGYDISSFPKYMFGLGKKYLQRRVFSYATRILAMSPDMQNDLIKAGCPPEKIIVHYYGTDCLKFFHEHKYEPKKIVKIITLSNMCPKKGHYFQFKAILHLINKGITNFRFRVIGSGELENDLRKFVTDNGLDGYIAFTGPVRYGSTEMMKELREADIFLHPSVTAPDGDKEGIPGTVIEAMASGLPVVSTYHAGIPFVVSDQVTGLLVKEWDIESLADKLAQLIDSHEFRQRLGTAAQHYAMENLTLPQKEKELEDIYDTTIRIFTT